MTRLRYVSGIVAICAIAPRMNAAAISVLDIFKNNVYTQTSGAAPTTPVGFFADVELQSAGAGDFNSVVVTYPGPASPTNVPQATPTFFSYGPSFATAAAMNAAIPFGTYNYLATNTSPVVSQAGQLIYSTDAFTSAIPALSATTFGALNGLNVVNALTVSFNSFTPNASASQGFTFFSIFDGTGNVVFSDGFLDPSTTSLLLPAGILLANGNYSFELDFSDRINGLDPSSSAFTTIGSDVRTDGTFTTGPSLSTVPEPTTLVLVGCGLFAVVCYKKRGA
jgi:hypothetical protein